MNAPGDNLLRFPDLLAPRQHSRAAIALAVLLILARTLGWSAISICAGAGVVRLLGL